MPNKLYTMSTTTPGSWQQFLDLLRDHPEMAIIDLRPREDFPDLDEPRPWHDVVLQLWTDEGVPPRAKYHYCWPSFLSNTTLLVSGLSSILQSGENIVCFDRASLADGSLRQEVASHILRQVPGVIHEELAWKNTSLHDQPKLVRFLCTIYGYILNIGYVEVELTSPSPNDQGLFHAQAKEVRVYGRNGIQRWPDFTLLPYWRAILDTYPNLFDGDETEEDTLKSVQDFLVHEHAYQESGLIWSVEAKSAASMTFDLRPLYESRGK